MAFDPTRKKNRLRDLLNMPDRGVGRTSGITGILSRLFRKMLMDFGIDIHQWRFLMEEYIRGESKNQMNLRDRTSIRGNLTKEFLNSRMTWKVFCRAMMFLKITEFKIVIIAVSESGRISEHSAIVQYRSHNDEIPESSLLKQVEEEMAAEQSSEQVKKN